ncbi:tRNA (N6-isopentenyl adenosine(37)-C2)-methylthiotransferase MiaB [Flavivirga jejuensis]|uniref:tRNA-2-methylthio-N(6)-dimethylallyladenosine synthase n=1 Tax=Flavivirga jejuensis TaxID=870487 RepID=A0ABT8WMR0_9FLAO|nr:tRNA (N6-isopentenyl adenosine(37)-C2)-methylthiotransferase MiaB [Flavivirga jejuensis]MDO5974437.1 tRNA (N6-isopentenyl adenosine(37)-C2)-methylthiotransferase MiaB [Flavivirga jejuensis]
MEKIIDENKQGESLALEQKENNKRKLFIESYGCAMNFSDSEIVASIMADQGFNTTQNLEDADLVLVNTCSIRDKAEQTVRKRLEKYNAVKREHNPKMKVGVLGCMAERLKTKFLEEEKIVDLVVGPDAYKDLPNLLAEVDEGRDAINVILSKEETYGDVSPVRLNTNGVTAFVSITRGCDNMCTFCVVPFTRGRERSRDPQSILEEVNNLWNRGFKEITLLGQNVDSYLWYGGGLKKDFDKASEIQKASAVSFSNLLDLCAKTQPKMRIRFSTSNPQDLTLDVIETMAKHTNICNHIHLPVQSGSDRILKEMNRLHTRKAYFDLIDNIRRIIPNCAISQDMIVGFPTETEEDFQDTISLMNYVKYNFGYMFTYSERPGTMAERKMKDDVPEEIKKRRLQDIVDLQREHSEIRTKEHLHTIVEVLIEKESKKSNSQWSGRTSQNIVAVFPKEHYKIGDFVNVEITDCTSATLIGEAIAYSENN